MDQGVLVAPFMLALLILALFDGRWVLGVWSFSVVALPTLRSRFGPVSVYWCDVAALPAYFVCMRWPPTETSQRLSRWFWALAVVHVLGIFTSFLRYDAILEPGYEALRYGIAFLPLVLLPRLADDDESMLWFWRGILAAALCMAAVALIQRFWRDLALTLEAFMYGARSQGNYGFAYRERALLENTYLRAHGMYATSTCFAGGASMAGALIVIWMTRARATWITWVALLASAIAMLLTFSRHGLLAWVLMLIPLIVHRPIRGVILPILLLASVPVLGASDFWVERINRGGVSEDSNLSSRLVDRPLELLERIDEEPVILLSGTGLGTDHIERPNDEAPSRKGFVSNSFALYLFYLGVPGLAVVLGLLGSTWLAAWQMEGDQRAGALGALAATVVVIASDNYAFLHTSFPFMWGVAVAVIQTYAGTQHQPPVPAQVEDTAAV